MKKIGFAFNWLGVLLILLFALADYLGFGEGGKPGAAQLLGIESGIGLILIGTGILLTYRNRDVEVKNNICHGMERILNLSPMVWVILTFLVLYPLFFVYPMFFSNLRVHYFVKYIPDAWVTRIGFDIGTTIDHVRNWLVDNQSPYADGVVPYSPLALAVFAPLILLGYPGYYRLLTLLTLAGYVVATLWIPARVSVGKSRALLPIFSLLGLFSYGFQFEMERGQFNVIAFAMCLLALYIYHYHHSFRFFAYLLFCLSIQLKLYPLIFIFMFINNWRDWRGNLKRLLGLGLINFALLFVLGYSLGIEFIDTITTRQAHFQSSRSEDLSISGFVYYLMAEGLGGNPVGAMVPYSRALEVGLLMIFGVCLFGMLAHVYVHNAAGLNPYLLTICTIGALMIPAGSFDYKLPILVAPLTLLFGGLPVLQTIYKKIAAIVLVIAVSAAHWSTLYPASVKPAFLARNFPALFVILISVTTLYFVVNGRVEYETENSS